MINLGQLIIPTTFDFIPETDEITFEKPEYLTTDYLFNIVCTLQIHFSGSRVFIEYYCDDDSYLATNLELDDDYIAMGDLEEESFLEIQKRALDVLIEHHVKV